jgi:hypothetical protein
MTKGVIYHYSNPLITNPVKNLRTSRTEGTRHRVKGSRHLYHQNQEQVVTVSANAGFLFFTSKEENK